MTAPRDPRKLLQPAYYHAPERAVTLGPVVGRVAAEAGYAPDPEQQLILDDVFAYGSDGTPASFEYGIVGPRQQLKTGSLIQCAIGWLFVLPPGKVQNINWTAHLRDTALKSFGELAKAIRDTPRLSALLADDRVGGIHTGKDVEKIITADGRLLEVSARTDRGGRGLTGDRVVLDEALYLTPAMMGAIMPTLTARNDAQAVYASTPGLASSETLRLKRDMGRAGLNPRMGWVEWGTERVPCKSTKCDHFPPGHPAHVAGCAMDDEALWWAASPLLGRRRANGTGLTVERMRDLRGSMPPAEWGREFLGWWDEPSQSTVFGDGRWDEAMARHEDETGATVLGYPDPVDYRPQSLGVAVAADLSRATLVAAGVRGDAVAVRVVASGEGFTWVPDYVGQFRERHDGVRVVLDAGGPTGVLAPDLAEVVKPSRRLTQVSFQQWKVACPAFWDGIRERRIVHGGQAELDEAARQAQQRKILDRWVWERYGYDASPLEAATLAAWAVTDKQRESAYEGRGVMTV